MHIFKWYICLSFTENADITCTFDDHSKCFMVNIKTDDFQWALNSVRNELFDLKTYVVLFQNDVIVEEMKRLN